MAGQIKVSILIAVAIAITAALYFVTAAYFPNSYSEEISRAAEASGLDEELIRAVIWTESKYREDAESSAGALGLMQLMPATRRETAERYGVRADGTAGSEIMLGSLYLAQMLELTGNETDALMAYNAGYGNVSRWKSGIGSPFAETTEYVKRVSFAKRIYSLL